MGDHAHVYFIVKIILNLNMVGRIGYMRYTFDIIVVSIGINFDLSCILIYVCMYVCFSIPIVSITIGIKLFIHIYVLFVLIISLYL